MLPDLWSQLSYFPTDSAAPPTMGARVLLLLISHGDKAFYCELRHRGAGGTTVIICARHCVSVAGATQWALYNKDALLRRKGSNFGRGASLRRQRRGLNGIGYRLALRAWRKRR